MTHQQQVQTIEKHVREYLPEQMEKRAPPSDFDAMYFDVGGFTSFFQATMGAAIKQMAQDMAARWPEYKGSYVENKVTRAWGLKGKSDTTVSIAWADRANEPKPRDEKEQISLSVLSKELFAKAQLPCFIPKQAPVDRCALVEIPRKSGKSLFLGSAYGQAAITPPKAIVSLSE